MASIWMLLSETKYDAALYQSHVKDKKEIVKRVNLPFKIRMEYINKLKKKDDNRLIDEWNDDYDVSSEDLKEAEKYIKQKKDEKEKFLYQKEEFAAYSIKRKYMKKDNQILQNIRKKMIQPSLILEAFDKIKSASRKMDKIKKRALKMGIHDVPILILGESGTGKELFARAIYEISNRRDEKFKAFNCSAIDKSLANATLFGWSKGAFTGAKSGDEGLFRECHNGILFLDEIADLDLDIQTKLLRVLESGEVQRVGDRKTFNVDVRIIAATNKDLMKMVSKGEFREDLFHRLSVGVLKIPPLRDRDEDIQFLTKYFMEATNEKFATTQQIYEYNFKKLTGDAKEFIENYHWPGNVRELKNTIQRAFLWSDKSEITKDDINEAIMRIPEEEDTMLKKLQKHKPIDIEETLNKIRTNYIKEALKIAGGNLTKAANLLGYNNYQTLKNHIEKLGIENEF
jgi:transcriptional regulator with PAS, ATPase and Fis domain